MSLFTGHDLTCIRGERRVFSGLDFALDAGGVLILTGPNGSGKSSLLRLMAGLGRPAGGTIRWNGEDIARDPETHNGRLHYVGHWDAVKPVLSARENVAFWTALRGGGTVEDALDALGIAHLADVPGRFLSAGQRRRVNLARLLAARAPLWLLDEPATALDRDSVARLAEAIGGHRAGGGLVVLSTHGGLDIPDAAVLDLGALADEEAFA